jgi:Ca2+:H+ antiporter
MNAPAKKPLWRLLLAEWPLLMSIITVGLSIYLRGEWFAALPPRVAEGGSLAWLIAVVILSAFAVVRHAEALAERMGEPYGTLILTISVTGIEVMMITAAMSMGHGQPALARDAMFSVVMIVLNGLVGAVLLIGGMRYKEQTYNLQGVNAFLSLIIPLAVLGLILPNFTSGSPGPTVTNMHAGFEIIVSLVIYTVFLAIQTSRHRHYFIAGGEPAPGEDAGRQHAAAVFKPSVHAIFLVAYLVPLVFLSKVVAHHMEAIIQALDAPPALGGFLVAVLVLSPESMTAIRAAWANQLQRSLNILLGSALATIALTISAVLTVGLITGQTIYLGVEAPNMIMLSLTLVISILTFSTPRTNILLGAVHMLLFCAFVMLMFEEHVHRGPDTHPPIPVSSY